MQERQDDTGIDSFKISVVVFTYNFEAYIGECLESLVRQTVTPFEIIVCDDCSTDNTWPLVEGYKARYPNLFRIFRHEMNLGHIGNGAFGKDQIRGNVCVFMDGDDRWAPTKLEKEKRALQADPDARIAYSGVRLINEQGDYIGKWEFMGAAEPLTGNVFLNVFAKRFFKNTRSLLRNTMVYTQFLREVGYQGYNHELIHADWDLMLRMTHRCNVVYSGDYLVDYRQHATSIQHARYKKLYASASKVISDNLPLLQNRSKEDVQFVLQNVNTLLEKLARAAKESPRQFSSTDVWPFRIVANSLPKSGTNLLTKLLALLPGLRSSSYHLGQSTVKRKLPAEENILVPVGVDMPREIALSVIDDSFIQLVEGQFISAHLPYSTQLDTYFQDHNIKMVLIVRDPRDVVVSHASYIARTKTHPLHSLFASLSKDDQIQTSIEGTVHRRETLLSISDRLRSVLPWIGKPYVFVLKFEELVGVRGGGSLEKQKRTIAELAEFLDVEVEASQVEEIASGLFGQTKTFHKGQIGSWRTELKPKHQQEIERIAGEEMEVLGYPIALNGRVEDATQKVGRREGMKQDQLIFLISLPRSGSTLLQRVLAGHSDIHTLAEPWVMLHPLYALRQVGIQTEYDTKLALHALEDFLSALPGGVQDYLDGIRAMALTWYQKAIASTGKSYFLDKTPRYYNIIPELYSVFPEAHIILLCRNPLAVLSSIVRTWVGKDWNRLHMHRHDIIKGPMLMADAIRKLQDNVIVLHYEELVSNPDKVLYTLCADIGVPYLPDLLEYGQRSAPAGRMGDQVGIKQFSKPEVNSLNKWQETFTEPSHRLLGEIMITTLGKRVIADLGYDADALLKEMHQLPLNSKTIPQKELVNMVSALQLSPEQLSKIQHLFEPYLDAVHA